MSAHEGAAIGRWCAAALILCNGRYLMQRRDEKPGILLPGHWGLFGGSIDPGENAATAIRRELLEELEFAPRLATLFTEMEIVLPLTPPRRDRMSFFIVPCEPAEFAALVQHEGSGMRLFAASELAREARVAPWDLAIVLMHARRNALFGG